jgi:chemotaxis protein methyltransferase CheR
MTVAVAPLQRAPQGDDYTRFCEGIHKLTGIDLLQYKRPQMERRIRTFAERRGTQDLNAYLATLAGDPFEREAFLDRVTINVSQLWRNPEQWTALARDIVPEIVQNGRVRAWSAGCSYGAEAYTLAALFLTTVPGCKPEIHGTDIDARMVARARDGRFSAEDARAAPPELLQRWFDRDGAGWKAKRELASLMRFDQGDLLRMPFPAARYDLVMCRNTVIYFNEDVRDALHTRLAGAIRPGGYLLIGSTERVADPKAGGLELVRPFLYRKQ